MGVWAYMKRDCVGVCVAGVWAYMKRHCVGVCSWRVGVRRARAYARLRCATDGKLIAYLIKHVSAISGAATLLKHA